MSDWKKSKHNYYIHVYVYCKVIKDEREREREREREGGGLSCWETSSYLISIKTPITKTCVAFNVYQTRTNDIIIKDLILQVLRSWKT